MQRALPITEANLYAGFDSITRSLLRYWRDRIVEIGDRRTTLATIADINRRLISDNAVIFFDHHYAFDALPAALILGQTLKRVTNALMPYAVHLDMGVDREGLPSLRYRLRTLAFRWLIGNIQKTNPDIHFLPIAREFELEAPRLKAIVDSRFSGSNIRYLKAFAQLFARNSVGRVCILSPIAGIAFPEKPALHPQLYRSMEMVQARREQLLPFYFAGAYPRLHAYYHYMAPLLTKHTFVAQGPFNLPIGDYEQANAAVSEHQHQLRQAVQFTPPDYSRISRK